MSAAKTPARDHLVLAGEPRVQLLPPSVRAKERVRDAQRLLLVTVVGAVAVAAATYGFGVFSAATAQAALASAQNQTQLVVAQQAKYRAGADAASAVAAIQQTQRVGTSLEVLWAPLIRQIRGSLPAGTELTGVTATGQTPWGAALVPEGPLRAPRIASVSLVISSPSVPDMAAITAALRALPGYADSSVQSTVASSSGTSTTISLTLGSAALSGRFSGLASDAQGQGASR